MYTPTYRLRDELRQGTRIERRSWSWAPFPCLPRGRNTARSTCATSTRHEGSEGRTPAKSADPAVLCPQLPEPRRKGVVDGRLARRTSASAQSTSVRSETGRLVIGDGGCGWCHLVVAVDQILQIVQPWSSVVGLKPTRFPCSLSLPTSRSSVHFSS